MRFLRLILWIVVGIFTLFWIGSEVLLARMVQRHFLDSDMPSAQATPLWSPLRYGLRLQNLTLDEGDLHIPYADLWVPIWHWGDIHLQLSPVANYGPPGSQHQDKTGNVMIAARFSPYWSMVLDRVHLTSGAVSIEGAAVLDQADVTARLIAKWPDAGNLPDAPRARAEAAYDFDLLVKGLVLDQLVSDPPGPLTAKGAGRFWIDTAPEPLQQQIPEHLTGIESRTGLILASGPLSLRLFGSVVADAEGRAQGTVVVYTRDALEWVDVAEKVFGLDPMRTNLIRMSIQNISRDPLPKGQWPLPKENEIQLALHLREGKVYIGPMPVADAPLFY